jgi:hypothetical protein
VTVNGADFGAAPIVTVDDVRVRKMELGEDYDRHGNSEIEFTVPARAESGRVEVKCGETHPQELVVGRSPSRRR